MPCIHKTQLTGCSKQWECTRQHTSHEHIRSDCTGSKTEIGINQVSQSTLENGEEAKAKAGRANAEPNPVSACLARPCHNE